MGKRAAGGIRLADCLLLWVSVSNTSTFSVHYMPTIMPWVSGNVWRSFGSSCVTAGSAQSRDSQVCILCTESDIRDAKGLLGHLAHPLVAAFQDVSAVSVLLRRKKEAGLHSVSAGLDCCVNPGLWSFVLVGSFRSL